MRRIANDGLVRHDQRVDLVIEKDSDESSGRQLTLFEATQAAIEDRFGELTADGSPRTDHSSETDDVLDTLGRLASGPFARYPAREGMAEVRKAAQLSPGLVTG